MSISRSRGETPVTSLRGLLKKDLFTLTLQREFDPGTQRAVDQLALRVSQLNDGDDPLPIVDSALQLVSSMQRSTDFRHRELARHSDEQRIARIKGPVEKLIRETEAAREQASDAISEINKEWTDRTKRQQAHALRSLAESVEATLQLTELREGKVLRFSIRPEWYTEFVSKNMPPWCTEWSMVTCDRSEAALRQALDAELREVNQQFGIPGPTIPTAPPKPQAKYGDMGSPGKAGRATEVPSVIGVLFRSARSSVIMFGMIAVPALSWLLNLAGAEFTVTRGGVYLVLFAVFPLLALPWAKGEQHRLIQKAREDAERDASKLVQDRTSYVLGNQRQALERWLKKRKNVWQKALDDWWEQSVQPVLRAKKQTVQQQLNEIDLEEKARKEDASSLKSLSGDLQKLVVKLRVFRKELEGAPGF